MDENTFSSAENSIQLEAFEKKIEELKKENFKLKKLLEQYGIVEDISSLSDVEYICVQQIKFLKDRSDKMDLTVDEVKNLDTLHKNLRQVRDGLQRKELKNNSEDIAELLSIVDGEESGS